VLEKNAKASKSGKMRNPSTEKKYEALKKLIKSKFKKAHPCNFSIGDVAFPEIFEIEPINTCNLRCQMCHVSFMKHDNVKIFDISLLSRLSSFKGKWVCIGSNFEPIMHPRFVEIMRYLSDMDCKIDLTTNGTLLKEKVADEMVNCNIKNVTISFDSIRKETYEKIRRGAKYESAVQRILYLRESLKQNDTFFAINSVLMRSNIDELIETIDFWELKEFHQIRLIFGVVRSMKDDILKESVYPIRHRVFEKLDQAAEHVINNNSRITLSSPYFNRSKLKDVYPDNIVENLVKSDNLEAQAYFNPRHYYQNRKYPGMQVGCCSPFTFAKILFNGDIQLCYKYVIGNLNEQNFEDIWYGENARRVRQKVISNSSICHTCDYFRFCLSSNKIDVNSKVNYFQQSLLQEAERIHFD